MYRKTKLLKIFNNNIIIHKVPKNLWNNNDLKLDILNTFNQKNILDTPPPKESVGGKAYSTCKFNNNIVLNLKNIWPLLNYINDFIIKYNPHAESISYTRIWMNKTFENTEGKCHTHNGTNDGTVIFYFNVPKNGSDLIILKEDIGPRIVSKEDKKISYNISVKSGDLIIHPKNVPHAVSKHNSKEERICMIIDYKVIEKNKESILNKLNLNDPLSIHNLMEQMKIKNS